MLHQVHAAKLTADLSAALVSTFLLWHGHTRTGFAVRYAPPVVASAAVLRRDLSRLRATRRGRYVLAHMTRAAEATRLAGDTVMAVGAARRRMPVVAAGLGVVVLGWCFPAPCQEARSICGRAC